MWSHRDKAGGPLSVHPLQDGICPGQLASLRQVRPQDPGAVGASELEQGGHIVDMPFLFITRLIGEHV